MGNQELMKPGAIGNVWARQKSRRAPDAYGKPGEWAPKNGGRSLFGLVVEAPQTGGNKWVYWVSGMVGKSCSLDLEREMEWDGLDGGESTSETHGLFTPGWK